MNMLKRIGSYLRNPLDLWEMCRLWVHADTSNLHVIFVVGAPRSGTTLLQAVLMAHPRLWGLMAETDMFTKSNLFGPNWEFGRLEGHVQNAILQEAGDIISAFVRLVREEARRRDAVGRFVEKTPQHVRRASFLLDRLPQARIIHISRDVRDAYASAHASGIVQGTSALRYGIYWKRCVREALTVRQSSRTYHIRYEEFVTDPWQSLSDLMEWLGLEAREEQLQPEVYGDDVRAEREMFKKLREDIDASSVGRWRHELSALETTVLMMVAGRELRVLGYE